MKVTVGTFNLNNLFGRWNLYVDVSEPPAVTAAAEAGTHPPVSPRTWLRPADAAPPPTTAGRAATPATDATTPASSGTPDVQVTISGTLLPNGQMEWRTNPFTGKLVYEKPAAARAILAKRIKAIDVDVLAVQEVEDVKTLEQFARSDALKSLGYKYIVLVEGNDERLIDVGLLSRYPLGGVRSWRHRRYKNNSGTAIFSRDLLEVDVLAKDRSRVLFTVFVNHLKSQLARNEQERKAGNERRKRQAETIKDILAERGPGPVVVLGDLNDTPDSARLKAIRDAGLVNALTAPSEIGGPYPASDPFQPTTTAWTHRYKESNKPPDYELFDQIWLSPDLAAKQDGAWVHRRTKRGGDATDHDPAWIRLDL